MGRFKIRLNGHSQVVRVVGIFVSISWRHIPLLLAVQSIFGVHVHVCGSNTVAEPANSRQADIRAGKSLLDPLGNI